MVLATHQLALPYTSCSSHNLGVLNSIKEWKNLLIRPIFIFNYYFWISTINIMSYNSWMFRVLLKIIFLGLGVMVARSFLVRDFKQLYISSITDLGILKANLCRVSWVIHCWRACFVWFFNKCSCDRLTNLSPIFSTRDFLNFFTICSSFVLSSLSTLFIATAFFYSSSICWAFWLSITMTWALRSSIYFFTFSILTLFYSRLFSNSSFCLSNFPNKSLFGFATR